MSEPCSCYNCMRPLDGIDEKHKFCWHCGAIQMQSCPNPACDFDSLPVSISTCPSCSQPFRYCSRCRRLHMLNQVSCHNGCPEGILTDFFSGFSTTSINLLGNRAMIQKGYSSINLEQDLSNLIPSNEESFSSPISNYGIIFIATEEGNIYGLNLVTGRRFPLQYKGQKKDLSKIEMKVSDSLLYFGLGKYIYGIDIVKREQIFCIKSCFIEMRTLVTKNNLFILGLDKNNKLLLYKKDISSITLESEITFDEKIREFNSDSKSNLIIVANGEAVYYSDQDCNIWMMNSALETDVLWENKDRFKRILNIALLDESLVILGILKNNNVCITYQEKPGVRTDFYEEEYSKYRFIPENLCVRNNQIYLCEPDKVNIYTINPRQKKDFKIEGIIQDPFIVKTNNGQYLLTMNIIKKRLQIIAIDKEAKICILKDFSLPYEMNTNPSMFYGAGNILILYRNPIGGKRLISIPFY